jgi:dihydrolipoamide dehydrogenase
MYDVLVIGGGPGGYAAAIRAAQLGGRTALVEAGAMGGVCVNVGCIPTKVWHRAAYLLANFKEAGEYGLKATLEGLDLGALKLRKDGVAADIRMGMEGLLANNGVERLTGRAVLKSPREAEVEGRVLDAGKIILATGSSLVLPDLPGLEEAALTSNQLLDLTSLPSSILVWGGGPIEVELATFLRIFGVTVTLIESERRILPREDNDTSQRVAQGLRELGVEILTRTTLKVVSPAGAGFDAVLGGAEERTVNVERVLVTARRPNTSGLGLPGLGVKLNEDGGIQVNDRLETAASGLYAVGDCTGGWMLSHAASAMAITAAENALGQSKKFPYHLISRGIWSIPEVGAVGLSEEEAEKAGHEVETGGFPYSINGLAMARNELAGEVKVVFDPEFGEILGVHIVGSGATELVGEAALAMQLECTVQELAAGFRAHPTYSEAVVDAARDARGWALYLPKR